MTFNLKIIQKLKRTASVDGQPLTFLEIARRIGAKSAQAVNYHTRHLVGNPAAPHCPACLQKLNKEK